MAHAPTPPDSGSCPTCGSPVERGQLVCLTCGGRVGLHYRRPPRWQVPVALAAAVVLLAVVGVFFALRSASADADKEVASGPASQRESRERTAAATPPETTEPTTTQRTTTETKPKAETEAEPPANAALAVAKRGPVAVLSGVPTAGAAKKYARGLARKGFKIGDVTNAPGGVGDFAVQYARGSEKPARALAKETGIRQMGRIDPAVADRAGGAKLVVIVGARK